MRLQDLPDTHPCYVPEIGETTLGEPMIMAVVTAQ